MRSCWRARKRITELLALLCFFGIASPATAQFNSGFEGTVNDPSGAAIPSAKITVINQATNVTKTTVSSESGTFRVSALEGGTYRITVESPGFNIWTQQDILLESNQTKTVYPVLSVRAQATTVEVKAAVAAVQTARSDTSREIDERTIDDAPLLGRNIYTSIIQLAPGITGSGLPRGGALGSGSANNDSFEQEPAYAINAAGQRQESNEYQVDGTSVVSASRDGVVNLTPEPDFVQAIRVSGANFSASKGRYSGALVQVYTKPGTNELHGSLSEFHTDNAITGRTIFQTCPPGSTGCHAVPVFRRNEFGGSLGGPIIRNKLFVFGGLFILRSSNATTQVAAVETPQFAQWVKQNYPNGIASAFFTQAAPASAPTAGILTVSQLEGLTPGHYPTPANLPPDLPAAGTGFFPQSPTHNAYQWHVRGDYNFNGDRDRLFADWFNNYSDQLQTDPRSIYRVKVPNHGVFGKFDWVHTFSPTLLNEASFTGGNADGANPGTIHNRELPNAYPTGISGFTQWGPAGWVHDNFNWHEVLTWTRGKHTIETGIDIDRHHDDDHFTSPQLRPSFSFANLIDFAQDLPFSQTGPAVKVADNSLANDLYEILRWLYWGAFVQDDWKMTRRFTLNLGVRFDYFGHWGNYHNATTPFPFFSPGSGSTFADQITNGSMSLRGGDAAYVVNNRPHRFSPRIGFGWDVFGDGKTAVRGGYGLYYNDVADGSWSFAVRATPPVWALPSFTVFENQPFSYALGDSTGSIWPVPSGLSFKINPAGGLAGIPVTAFGVVPDADQPRTHNWMFGVQHDFGHNLAAEADYNGSHSNDLYVQTDVNRFPGDLVVYKASLTLLKPYFGPIIYGRTIGTADGHYGTLMLTKRFSRSWQVRGIFTFGKATDELSSNDNGTNNGEAVFNALNVANQHGLSDYDVGRRFTLDGVWDIPTPFRSGLAKSVLGGWRMSHILVLQSGLPFTVYTSAAFSPIFDSSGNVAGLAPGSGDFDADGYNYDLPGAPSFGNHKSTSRSDFIKGFAPAAAFSTPAPGHAGSLGRNTFIGPGLASVNSEFAKTVRIQWFTPEGASLELRADIFNLFNRVNLTQPISDLSSSLFGMSVGQTLPRSSQFGIHIEF